MAHDARSDLPALAVSGFLIEAVVYAAVNPRVIDIVRDLFKRGVVQNDARKLGIAQNDRVSIFAEYMLEDATCGRAETGVTGRIAGKWWREDQRLPRKI